MPTLYVNKSGSNSNDGSTEALAKLTIQAAVTAASSGDTVIVGSGSYNERVAIDNKALTLTADGIVVIDGAGLGGTGAAIRAQRSSTFTDFSVTIGISGSGSRWILVNHNTGSSNIGMVWLYSPYAGIASELSHRVQGVTFIGNGSAVTGVSTHLIRSGNLMSLSVTNCVFVGLDYGVLRDTASTALYSYNLISSNTFYNCTTCIDTNTLSAAGNNIFHTGTTGIYCRTTGPGANANGNIYYNLTNFARVVSTTYTDWATWQGTGAEANGSNSDPGLAEPDAGVFFLTSAGSAGAYPKNYDGIVRSDAYDPDGDWDITATADNSGWYTTDDIVKNGTDGALELNSGTTGTLLSPIFDLGASTGISQINLVVEQTWPTNMIDYDKTDIRPNYQSLRVRASASTFDQDEDAGTLPWTEVQDGAAVVGVSGRYVQVELMFRTDDVAA